MNFFLLSLIPIAVWGFQWLFNKRVVWQEAAIGTGVALLTATIFCMIEAGGAFVPSDTEVWSDRVNYAQHQPPWVEYYEYAVYRTETYTTTDSKGNVQLHTRQVFDHWQPTTERHDDNWWVNSRLESIDVNSGRYEDIKKEFGSFSSVDGSRSTFKHNSHMISGSPYDERTQNVTGYIYPIAANRKFENRLLKAKDTLYSFQEVPIEQARKLFEWPKILANQFETNRLLGSAKNFWDGRQWDQMNAVLGPTKNVNLIAIGFPAGTALETGMLQERYWKGGKKNDLVLTFGGDPNKPEWAYVFGWTEKELVKRLLENRLREGTATIDEISSVVRAEYQLLPFEEKFAHIEIETPWWYYLIFFVVVAGSQDLANFFFSTNEYTKSPIGK
jgi:hypothetical protein